MDLLDMKLKHVLATVVLIWLFALGVTRRAEQSNGSSSDVVSRFQNHRKPQKILFENAIKAKPKINVKKTPVKNKEQMKKRYTINEEVAEVVSLHKDSGNPHLLITFTNDAEAKSMKSFLCNLKELGMKKVLSQLVVITKDQETQETMSKFASPDHVFHRTYLDQKQAKEELPDLAQFRIYFVRELLRANVSLVILDTTNFHVENQLGWLDNQTGFDVIVGSPDYELLETDGHQAKEKAFSGAIFLNSTENARRLWDRAEQETRFLWSQNDTKHYSERLAMNFILTLKEQKSEEGMKEMAERYYPFLHSLAWTYFPTNNSTEGNSDATYYIKEVLCHFD